MRGAGLFLGVEFVVDRKSKRPDSELSLSRLSFIGNLLEPLWMHIGPSVRQSVPNDTLFRSAAQNHKDIYSAIVACDPKAAVTAIHCDILEGYTF